METGIKVGDCMKTRLITVSEKASVFEAATTMKKKDVGSLVVVNEKSLPFALITAEDLVKKAIAGNKMSARIGELASKPLIGIEPEKDLSEAAKLMGAKNIKRLVVFKQREVVGIISSRDIIKISPSLYDLIAEKEHIEMLR